MTNMAIVHVPVQISKCISEIILLKFILPIFRTISVLEITVGHWPFSDQF